MNYREMSEILIGHREKGFSILAFPCNQFGKQEPGTHEEIKKFAAKYDFQGDMFAKCEVNGSGALPLYKFLKSKKKGLLGSFIKWNFTKFLLDRDGNVVRRFGPSTSPKAMLKVIEALLEAPAKQ